MHEKQPPNASAPSPVDTLSRDGHVDLPLGDYHALWERSRQSEEPSPPHPWAISRARYDGDVQAGRFEMAVTLSLEVFSDRWVRIPLFAKPVALADIRFHKEDASRSQSEAAHAPASGSGPAPSVIAEGGSDRYVAQVKGAGRYTLTCQLTGGLVGGGSGSGIDLTVPLSSETHFKLVVPGTSIVASIEGAFHVTTEAQADGERSVVEAFLPPSNTIKVEWSSSREEERQAKVVQTIATADVATLVAVGEGVARCTSRVTYDVAQGALDHLALRLPADVVLLGCDGQAIRRWESEPAGDGETQTLRVNLHYPMQGHYALVLSYERAMPETAGRLDLPVLHVEGVERQRGHIGIEARTTVEITPVEATEVARVDIQEMPSDVWDLSMNPLLFGWKYLRVPYSVTVDIRKHADVEVLVATVDAARLEATLVADGKMTTKCTFMVRNNQKQFLRVTLPPASVVWSTFVANRPVKPAHDKDAPGTLLITLEKSQDVAAMNRAFSVELVYLTTIPAWKRNGKLAFMAPKLDVPINTLQTTLHLPADFKYNGFEGTMTKTASLRHLPVFDEKLVRVPAGSHEILRSQAMTNVAQEQAMSETSLNLEDEFAQQAVMAPPMMKKQAMFGGSVSRGVLPVRMDVPASGKTYYFEQLLVIREHADIAARYGKGFWG